MYRLFALLLLPVVLIVAAFVVENSQLVAIDLFTGRSIEISLSLLLIVTLLLGMILSLIGTALIILSLKRQIHQLKRKQKKSINEHIG